jgi:hypothetical protein
MPSAAEPISVGVLWPGDVSRAAGLGKSLAAASRFSEAKSDEIALVITKLAANLIRHASGGTILVRPAIEGERTGIEVQSVDNGLGIPDVEQAIADGYSTAGGWDSAWAPSTGSWTSSKFTPGTTAAHIFSVAAGDEFPALPCPTPVSPSAPPRVATADFWKTATPWFSNYGTAARWRE